MASNIPPNGNTGRSSRGRQFAQFLLLMGNRIYLNATQQLLHNTGFGVALLAVSYLLSVFYPAPVGVGTANVAPVFLLGSLLFTGLVLIAFTVVAPAFPRAARFASRVSYKFNHIFFGGPP